MLTRQRLAGGIVVYVSPLLKQIRITHAFSTRIGGKSVAPFDSMNLGNPNGCSIQDSSDRIAGNYDLLQSAAGFRPGQLCWVHQVHGNGVVRALKGEVFDRSTKADAIVTDDPAKVLSIRVADCVPVLLADRGGKMVAAVHSGWRGVMAGVAPQALREMKIRPESCIAAIGPSIGMDAFEVGPEVLAEFQSAFGNAAPIRHRDDGKGHVDLRTAIFLQLQSAGVPCDQIDSTDRCTHRDREEFFSHRRDNGITGRMAAFIQCRES